MNTINKYQEESKQLLHGPSVISILLDSYADIFSDFDPSAYSERILSDDFIIQAKNMSKHKKGNKMSLRLLLPKNMRNEQDEKIIIKRLHSYFKSVHQALQSEVRKANTKGFILALIGIIVMIAASYISFMKPEQYHVHFVLVLFEPAGWFLLWTGLDHLVHSSKEPKKDLAFYLRMTKSEINFFTHG
jgi:hypothetical protein